MDPRDITIIAKNPRCPGTDQKGSIFLSNASAFPFSVNVKGLDGSTTDITLPLGNSSDFTQTFPDLPIGGYDVTFVFDPDKKPDNTFPPSYTVQITALPEMTADEQGVSLKTKTGSFMVSGSENYTVETNGKKYKYTFENTQENLIQIPLNNGVNSILISGDAVCLGVIKKELLLNSVFIYPNPADKLITVLSEALIGEYELHLFDMGGRMVYREKNLNSSNRINLDVSKIQKGMYLGKINSKQIGEVIFKLIKN